jgi:hypothetical protein
LFGSGLSSEDLQGGGNGDSGGGKIGVGRDFISRLKREGAKTGAIQISLLWNNYNDLDLHVRCPSNERIFYSRRQSRCGGELDVDMNVGPNESREPVENVYWPVGRAPRGRFEVAVQLFRNHGEPDPSKFKLRVVVDGKERYFTGEVSARQPSRIVHRFTR